MPLWLIILFMGLVTFALRLLPVILLERIEIPLRVRQALRFVPLAVLSAIIFPEVLQPRGALDLSLGNARLLAGGLAMLVAWRTKNVLLTIAVGMGALWILQAIL
ncbi:MAG: branched-chain amino acid ABC transporter permease [Chloroflexi bacterium RBG_16_63_12]|jgi:branched-subunit amino acid transport protein|nr:MAG: branched-chain amino acid ABC transporter permease [Chloroflexi bacterium RBG_16_63_12]